MPAPGRSSRLTGARSAIPVEGRRGDGRGRRGLREIRAICPRPADMASERYNPARGGAALAGGLGRAAHLRDAERRPAPEILRARDVPLSRRGASTWATSATTRWATSSPATCAPRATTSSTPWAGTPSACRPRTPRCRTSVHPKAGPTTTSPRCAAQLKIDGPVARLEPRVRDLRSRLLRATSRSCSSTSSTPAWSTARSRRSTGTRSTRPCSPTSR